MGGRRVERSERGSSERGSAAIFVLVFVVVVSVLASGVVAVGHGATSRARAQSVADLVALATVVHGDDAAADLAAANGATLRRLAHHGHEVEVVVEWQGRAATASAAPGADDG